MSRVILHIGTHKTATTTLQDMFAHNATLLEAHGVIYPRLGRASGHHGLVMDWNHFLPPVYALEEGSLGTLRQLAADHGAGDHTVVLSSEEFSRGRAANRPDFAAIREALTGFDRIEVVCVLREQWQFIQSIYLEISKSRQPPRPPQLIDTVLVEDMVEGLWTDYNLLYDHLLETFAPEEITFLDFDHCRKAQGGILGAMLDHLGCGLAPEALEPVNGGLSNASPQALPGWAANIITEPLTTPAWMVEATTGAFGVQFGEGRRSRIWTREECRMLQGYAARCNRQLAERLAPYQPGFAINASPLPTAGDGGAGDGGEDVFREDVTGDFWMRCSRWTFGAIRRGTTT